MPFFDVRLRIRAEWFEDVIEAESGGDAAIVLGDRLLAEFGDPAGIEEMHVTRMQDMQAAQPLMSEETPR